MSSTSEALAQLANQKSALKVIANRYLPNDEKLDDNCTLQDIIDVMENYDEATYMNAFLNSIEVFPDKDYSINDTEGHIKGLRPQAFYVNTALKSVFLPAVTAAPSNAQWFRDCSNILTINMRRLAGSGNLLYCFANCTLLERLLLAKAGGTVDRWMASSPIKVYLFGGICNFSNASTFEVSRLQALVLTNQTSISTIATSTIATNIAASNGNVYVPSSLKSTYQTATNWVTIENAGKIKDIESNVNDLRTLGVDFSLTPYANKKWDGTALVTDSTIGEEVDE